MDESAKAKPNIAYSRRNHCEVKLLYSFVNIDSTGVRLFNFRLQPLMIEFWHFGIIHHSPTNSIIRASSVPRD